MTASETLLGRLEDPAPDDVGAWVRCRVTGVVGQVWSYGKTRRWRIVADGVRYTECLAEHLMPIATPAPAVVVELEAEQESLW